MTDIVQGMTLIPPLSASARDTGKDVETVFLYVPNTF